jgi:hypothetical protein
MAVGGVPNAQEITAIALFGDFGSRPTKKRRQH